jgi:hypothetical protein
LLASPDLEVSLKRRLAGAVPILSPLIRFLVLVRSCRLQLPFCVSAGHRGLGAKY